MGIYCRKETGVFYAKKMINGILIRISLETKDKIRAYHIFSEWENRLLTAKLNGDEKLPLPLSYQQKLEAKKAREINKPTLLQAFNEHLAVSENKHITESHMLSKKQIKKLIISQKIGWDNLTQENILKIQSKLKAEFSIHTVYKLIAHLKTFLNYAVKQGFISYDTYKRLDFMKRPPRTNSRIKFSDEDMVKLINRLIETHDIDALYYIITLYFTASRPSEIVNLSHKDIDFKNERVSVWMSKTQKYKTVSLPRFFLDELMNLVKFNERTDAYLFLGQGRQKEFYSKKFKALREALNLNPEYNLYLFRHTAGTKALGMSQNIHLVKELLGHDNIKTTSKYYMLDNPEHTRPAIDKLIEGVYGKRKNEISGIIGILPKIQIAFPALIFSLFCITI